MQLQVHQETDMTKNCWHRTWRSSVQLIKQLESFDMQAFYFVWLLTLSGIFCFLKFWVQNVSCLCAILGGVRTPVATAWWRQRGSTWAGRFSRWPTSALGGGARLFLSLYNSSLTQGKEGTDVAETPTSSEVCRRQTSAEEKFAQADLLKFDGSLRPLTGACWVKCGRLLVVRYCCSEFCAVASWRNWDGYS